MPALLILCIFYALSISAPANPSAPSPAVNPAQRPPVVLVHGIIHVGQMESLARYLRAQGFDARIMQYRPCWGEKGIAELGVQLATFMDANFPRREKVDLIGFSMGGLVTRYYLQRLGGLARVRRYLTISAPHHGSVLAYLLPNPGGRDLRPGSPLLRDLARDADRLASVQFTSFWTPLDLIILPPRSSIMAQAHNVKLYVVAHPLMVLQRSCQRAVAAALAD